MSPLPRSLVFLNSLQFVSFISKNEIETGCDSGVRYSITSSASATRLTGSSMPDALAVLRFTTNG